jgi:phosphoglycerate dehydrogenase-like enzyme
MRPLVAIIDWAKQPLGEPTAAIETAILQDLARVKTFFCDAESDFEGEILDASVIILWHNIRVTKKVIQRLRACRAIIRNGVGYDGVDCEAARERGVPVCNVPDYGTEEVADHAIALALSLARQIIPLDQEAKQLGWKIRVESKLRRLRELTFGIVGLGRIGTATALRARALGFKVCFYDPYVPNGVDKAVGVVRLRQMEQLLRVADILSLHCPLNPETRHLITERELRMMRAGAFIVNTARGAIIEKNALLNALREGRLAGAGLDVVEDEPLKTPEEAATPNLIVTCHAAFCSVESKCEMRSTSARIAHAAVLNLPLENIVNEVIPKSKLA